MLGEAVSSLDRGQEAEWAREKLVGREKMGASGGANWSSGSVVYGVAICCMLYAVCCMLRVAERCVWLYLVVSCWIGI